MVDHFLGTLNFLQQRARPGSRAAQAPEMLDTAVCFGSVQLVGLLDEMVHSPL